MDQAAPAAPAGASFAGLPSVLQASVWSMLPRRALVLASRVGRDAARATHALRQTPSFERTRREARRWIARLDHAAELLRWKAREAAAELADEQDESTVRELALLFVALVPPPITALPREPEAAIDAAVAMLKPKPGRRYDPTPQARAFVRLAEMGSPSSSAPTSTPSSSNLAPRQRMLPTIPLPLRPNVADATRSQAVGAFHSSSGVRKIVTGARWVLNHNRTVRLAALEARQRREMERHRCERADAGIVEAGSLEEEEDDERCNARLVAEHASQLHAWEEEQKDFLFELQFVLQALLDYTANEAEGEADADPGAESSLVVSTTEQLHINDPEQDLASTEGALFGRYTTNLWVLPLVATPAEDEARREAIQAVHLAHARMKDQEAQAEAVRAMLGRFDAKSDVERAAREESETEHRRRVLIATWKGVSPYVLTKADLAPPQDELEAEAEAQMVRLAPPPVVVSGPSPTEVALAATLTSVSTPPCFLVGTTHFRDERRANNSRRATSLLR